MVEHKSKESQKKKVGTRRPISKFPIVGIGASAGGFEAFELFFKNMPPNSGMAFVVIQHLDPTRIGIMPELLQRMTTMRRTLTSELLLRMGIFVGFATPVVRFILRMEYMLGERLPIRILQRIRKLNIFLRSKMRSLKRLTRS